MPRTRKDMIEEQLEEMPEITKNEVVQETDFFKATKKYEGETSLLPLIVLIIIIVLIIAGIFYLFL